MIEFLTVIGGVFKFWDEVSALVNLLKKTPEEQRDQVIANVHAAFDKAESTKGDTSDVEKAISG